MTGDDNDIRQRLRLTLPTHWFADTAPVLDGLLTGLSTAWSGLYTLLALVRVQSRVRTATASFLDLASADYFAERFDRRPLEDDLGFRLRLLTAMRRERATRDAVTDAAAQAGFSVAIFEPAQPIDTGAYNVPNGLAWGIAGGWGSLAMPFECLVAAEPGLSAIESELWRGVAEAMPAGGAAWLRIAR